MKHIARLLFGTSVAVLGLCAIALLLFIYGAVLFSDDWSFMDTVQDTFRILFSIPSGVLMLYVVFIGLFIPALLLVILGWYVVTGRYIVSRLMLVLLIVVWAVALSVGFFLTFTQTQNVLDRVEPFSQDPLTFDVEDSIPDSVQFVFRTTLKNEAERQFGVQRNGFEPHMFLSVFPGLTESDFNGIESSVGRYYMNNARLEHEVDTTRLVHPAAKAITDRGFDSLLANVSVRLGIDLGSDGTITKIMDALVRAEPRYDQEVIIDEPEVEEDMIMCTMDVKICPDGSAVGRTAPSCAFAQCPGSM